MPLQFVQLRVRASPRIANNNVCEVRGVAVGVRQLVPSGGERRQGELVAQSCRTQCFFDIAPLPDLLQLAERYDTMLYVDDAHGFGVIGDRVGRKYVIWCSILGVLPFTLLLPYANLFWTGVLAVLTGKDAGFADLRIRARSALPGCWCPSWPNRSRSTGPRTARLVGWPSRSRPTWPP